VKFVGTSNSVLLIPPSDQSEFCEDSLDCDGKDDGEQGVVSVIKVAAGSMELVEVAPRLDKLKLLLCVNPYRFGEEIEMKDLEETEKSNRGLYKWDDLVQEVQASDDELRSGLQALSAVEIGSYWRIVDEKYMDTILRMLLHNSVLNDWSLDALNEDEVVGMLESDGFPQELARHCLDVYGSKVDESVGSHVWRLDERRVCVHFAREILKEGKRKTDSFMAEWLQKIPEGMHASFDMLEGEILTERLGVETWVRPFSVSSLPSSPAERFSILFRERPKWELKDLQPYIRFDFVFLSSFSSQCYSWFHESVLIYSIVQGSECTWSFFGRFAPKIHSKNTANHGCRTCFKCKIVWTSISLGIFRCHMCLPSVVPMGL
jgi:sister chromatid cohesion protein DCC1